MVKRSLPIALCCLVGLLGDPRTDARAAESTLERIKRERVLRWGADPSGGAPFVYVDPKKPDEVIGFEFDLMQRLAQHLGVKAELVSGQWETLIDNLRARRIDVVMNGLEINRSRAEKILFTTPYYIYEQQLTVREEDRQRYRSLADLKGKKVAVLGGSASVEVLKKAGWDDDLILKYDDSLTPYTELRLRRVEAAMAESIIADFYTREYPDLHNLLLKSEFGMYGAALRVEDTDLLDEINRILERMKRNGELGEIYRKGVVWTPLQERLGILPGKESTTEDEQAEHSVIWLLLRGSLTTLALTAIAMPLALIVGLGLALMGRSHTPLLRWPARAYIQVIRGTPLMVQIFLIYYTLPQVGQLLGLGELLTFNNFVVGVLCLAANYAAYEAEIHRAGIEAVPRGQREAALSLGMSERQSFYFIVLPQSFRIILPPVLNDLIAMLKDSCIVYVVGVQELLTVALGIGKSRFNVPQMLVAAAVLYLVLSLAADWLGKRLEARLRQRGFRVVAGHTQAH
jgi:polar amino acid transport system substrate-binding protein